MRYWVARAEATFAENPAMSRDMVRAISVEMGAVSRCGNLLVRVMAQLLSLVVTVAVVVFVVDVSGLWYGLTNGFGPVLRVFFIVVGVLAMLLHWFQFVSSWVADAFAHRGVLARERLNRWLVAPADGDSPAGVGE